MDTNKILKRAVQIVLIMVLVLFTKCIIKKVYHANQRTIGEKIDSFNDIPVFYNGSTATNLGRNRSTDGYNYGLKYQCVEFKTLLLRPLKSQNAEFVWARKRFL
jgi:hypothetical protein